MLMAPVVGVGVLASSPSPPALDLVDLAMSSGASRRRSRAPISVAASPASRWRRASTTAPDHGDDQQGGCDLESEQVGREDGTPDEPDVGAGATDGAAHRSRPGRPMAPGEQEHLHEPEDPDDDGDGALGREGSLDGLSLVDAEEHDDEQEQHDDRPA